MKDAFASLTSVRQALSSMNLSTSTPGLKGDDRHRALCQRLTEALQTLENAQNTKRVPDTQAEKKDCTHSVSEKDQQTKNASLNLNASKETYSGSCKVRASSAEDGQEKEIKSSISTSAKLSAMDTTAERSQNKMKQFSSPPPLPSLSTKQEVETVESFPHKASEKNLSEQFDRQKDCLRETRNQRTNSKTSQPPNPPPLNSTDISQEATFSEEYKKSFQEEQEKIANFRKIHSESSLTSLMSDVSSTTIAAQKRIKVLKKDVRQLKNSIRTIQSRRAKAIGAWSHTGFSEKADLAEVFCHELEQLATEEKHLQTFLPSQKTSSTWVENGTKEMQAQELICQLNMIQTSLVKKIKLLEQAVDLGAYQEAAWLIESQNPDYGVEAERALQVNLRRAEGELVAEQASLKRSLKSAPWTQDQTGQTKPPPPMGLPPTSITLQDDTTTPFQPPSSANSITPQPPRPKTPNTPEQRLKHQIALMKQSGELMVAKELYTKLLESASDAETLCDYALFLQKDLKEHALAEEHFLKAIEKSNENPGILTNFACFKSKVYADLEEAEALHKRAVQSPEGNKHAGALGNYAHFLHTVKKDFQAAEILYKECLKISPTHANNLANYARLLKDTERLPQAELLFKAAFKSNPNNIASLCNYANFMSKFRGKPAEAKELYRRGLALFPTNQMLARNYGCFLRDYPEMRDATGARGYVQTRSKKREKRKSSSQSQEFESFTRCRALSVLQETYDETQG